MTHSERDQIEREFGIRYSELLRLPYFDIIRCHLVDPMHNLFLGTTKKLLVIWKEQACLRNLDEIQNDIDKILPPANVGRIPYKISAGFSGFTA